MINRYISTFFMPSLKVSYFHAYLICFLHSDRMTLSTQLLCSKLTKLSYWTLFNIPQVKFEARLFQAFLISFLYSDYMIISAQYISSKVAIIILEI